MLPFLAMDQLNFNGEKIESSKIKVPVMKKWIIGKDDETALRLKDVECKKETEDGQELIHPLLLSPPLRVLQ